MLWKYDFAVKVQEGNSVAKWNVLSYNDLINSKLKSQRPKDLLDMPELEKIWKSKPSQK